MVRTVGRRQSSCYSGRWFLAWYSRPLRAPLRAPLQAPLRVPLRVPLRARIAKTIAMVFPTISEWSEMTVSEEQFCRDSIIFDNQLHEARKINTLCSSEENAIRVEEKNMKLSCLFICHCWQQYSTRHDYKWLMLEVGPKPPDENFTIVNPFSLWHKK